MFVTKWNNIISKVERNDKDLILFTLVYGLSCKS